MGSICRKKKHTKKLSTRYLIKNGKSSHGKKSISPSVGFNIMDGVTDIMTDNDEIKFTIKETSAVNDFEKPVFAHSRNGANRDWQSKIDGFRDKINDGLGDKADIAFFKLCYVDITGETDVAELFESYRQTMNEL